MKSSIDSKENFYSVLGISMGDEGKGRVVHEILEQDQKHKEVNYHASYQKVFPLK